MFITFTTDAYKNITYFNDIAKQLLLLMGHSGTVPGALKADEIPEALGKLQSALGGDKQIKPDDSGYKDDDETEIQLAKRALPLIDLLEAAIKKNCDVLWDTSKSPG